MNKKISIIIVTYNSQKYMVECINSVGEFLDIDAQSVEIIIVDNSNEINAEEIKQIIEKHPLNKQLSIKYHHNKSNLGYGHGNNIGISKSSGDIIAVMNPDVRFGSKILKDVQRKFKNEKLGLLAYKQMGGFNHSFYIKPEFRNVFYGFFEKFFNKVDVFFPKCFYLSGAFFFLDKQKFEEVGNFDENIFMYYEEPDIANRLQKKGYEIQYDKTKKYHHLVGNRTGFSEIAFEREIRSLVFYLDKFKINKKKYFKTHLTSLKIKIALAKILKDKTREESFKKEIEWLKNLQKDSTLI